MVDTFFAASGGTFCDDAIFAPLEADSIDDGLHVVEVRAWRAVVVILGDARGELDDYPILAQAFLFLELVGQIAELSADGPAGATTA